MDLVMLDFFVSFTQSNKVSPVRHILGHINYPTVSFLPGFLSALVAIQIERPSRRALLATYLANVASECAFNACVGAGFLQPIRYGSVLLFIVAMAVLGGCYHSKHHQPPQMVAAVFRYFFGSAECGGESHSNQHSQLQHSPTSAGMFNQLVTLLWGCSPCCPHTGPCWRYAVKGAVRGAVKGGILSVLFRAVTSFTLLLRRPSSLPSVLRLTPHLRVAACVWWSCVSYRLCCCVGRHVRGAPAAVDGMLAGAVAGAGMVLCPAPSLALYAFWKALESLCSVGVSCGALPAIPSATELLYSVMTGYLFHVSAVHQHYMKPSYWGMLMRLTDRRMAEFNRHLLHPYGQDSGRNFANFWPNYDSGALSPAFIKRYANGLTDIG